MGLAISLGMIFVIVVILPPLLQMAAIYDESQRDIDNIDEL